METSSSNNTKEVTLKSIQGFEGRYPKQLWYLAAVEMWERFCFYGMRGMLVVFMVSEFLMSDQEATLKYAAIQSFVYAFTFVGGIFADKVLGFNRSLIFGAILMIGGNLLAAISPHDFFFFGISLVVIGTGFFKPNISSMVGYLYKDGDKRKDAGFGLFYTAINVGALIGGILCVTLGKTYSWSLAFLAASIVMTIGLITFLLTRKHLGSIGHTPLANLDSKKRTMREVAVYIGALLTIPLIFIMIRNTTLTDIFMFTVGPVALIYFFWQMFKIKDKGLRKKMWAALILMGCSILFFALFEQAGGALSAFANSNLTSTLLFFNIDPNAVNNGANSLYVIAFSTPLGLLWLWLAKRKKEPNTVVKFGLGFLLVAVAFYVLYSTVFHADGNGITSLNVFAFAYLFMTLGELCLSPIGLSMVTSLSPKHLSGMMMGLWFLASAYGQYVAGILGKNISSPDPAATPLEKLPMFTDGFQQLAIYALIIGIIILLVSPFIRKLMQDVK